MIQYILNSSDIFHLKKLEATNKDEILSWKLPNLMYPLFIIAASVIGFLMFKNPEQVGWLSLTNLLLNGSLPMVAINRLSSLGVNIFKFNAGKEKDKGKINTYNLRIKIHYYSYALIFSIAFFYIFQVINTPFPLSWYVLIHIIISIFLIDQSLRVSKYAFLLQEKLSDNTYDKEIRDEIEEKGHAKNWDE